MMLNLRKIILVSLWRISRFLGLGKKDVNVLCYHSISKNDYHFSISADDFKEQIKKISKHSRFVSIEEVVKMTEEGKLEGPAVAVTFDDAYQDIMNALPVIEEYGIKPAIFVFSRPDEVNRKDVDNNLPFLTFEQIKWLSFLGWTIGSHGATHAYLGNLSEEEMRKEIINSKKELEEKLGFKIKYFSYPKGIYDKKMLEAVKKAGYKAAFTIDPHRITKKTDLLVLPRTIIDKTRELSEFPALYAPTTLFIRKITDKFKIWDIFFGDKIKKLIL